jgi:hypothetical protein
MSMTGTEAPLRWSAREDAYLQREWEGKTDRELGDVLGRSKNAVHSRRHLLGLVQIRGEKTQRSVPGRPSGFWTMPKGYDAATVAWARENPLDREARAILAHLRDPAAAGGAR